MTSSNYESFNARNLTPEEVAVTFVPSADYTDLWRNDHTVVLGPRGSGKTTLLKMLTVQALNTWNHTFAIELRSTRPFTAIYVPTDMHWHHQLKHCEELVARSPKLRDALSRCAVTTSILLAVIKTFQARVRYEANLDSNQEHQVSKEIIRVWRISRTLPSFEMIALSLKERISQIRSFINDSVLHSWNDNFIDKLPDYFSLDYFAATDFACSVFDSVFKLPQSKKWALCLDEIELAPDWLQSLALSQVRSSDQNYLIKVSTSPIPSVSGTTGAQPREDFHLISIWNHSGRDSQPFSAQLAESVLQRRLGNTATLQTILGSSPLATSEEDEPPKYDRGSSEWRLFKELAVWDDSFRNLLIDNELNPLDPVTDDIAIKNTFLRKAKPIALFRSSFLKKSEDGRFWFRSRKVAGVYCGMEAVLRVSDGNPRRLIGIMNDLLAKVRVNADGQFLPLSVNEQDEILSKVSAQFLGYVNALPGGTTTLGEESVDLATILKSIATYFRQSLLGENFQLDPVGSFVIDSHLNPQVIELIRLGVYHGAIVHIDPLPDTIETSVVGKRFRLSYMMAPISRLPLTLYSAVSITRILKSSNRIRIKRAVRSLEQPELKI